MVYFPIEHIFVYPSVGVQFLVNLNGNMFLRTPSVGATFICGCTWFWSWEHDKSLNKSQQDLIKLNTITSSLCRRLETCKMSYLVLVGIIHQMRSMWYYGFIAFFSKQILQVLRIEMVGFLSQNYITLHNNLVNMIVLLEYFPTSISVCIWNKLYASFYLKDVMNMSLFKNFKWSVVHRDIVHQEEITGMNWV
jgi:hypothetical protein